MRVTEPDLTHSKPYKDFGQGITFQYFFGTEHALKTLNAL